MLVAVGLVAACALALQVLLTRLLAAVLFYHFGFLAISLALLGTGAGGLLLYVRPRWFERPTVEAALARWSALLALLLVTVPALLVRVSYDFGDKVDWPLVRGLGLVCVLAALPFTAAGIVIALAIREYTRHSGRVYAADLVGAGIGAAVVVPAMWISDPATLIVALGAAAAVAAILFAGPRRPERLLGGGLAAIAGAVTLIAASTSLLYLEPWTHVKPFAERWTPLSRVIGYPAKPNGRFALLFYDRVYAPVPLYRRGAPNPDARRLGIRPQAIGYAMAPKRRALVIGGGGGRDIHNALSSGVRDLDVIELNQGIVDVVDEDLREWSGSPYSLPRVHTTVGDGRSILASRDTRYDQIHIGFTDTLSANSAAAFALTENNLYTTEAFDEYYDRLTPEGVLNVSRLHRLVGDEALRVTVLTLEALRKRGVADPERNVVVLLSRDVLGELFGTTLSRTRPWTAAELARIRALAAREGAQVAFAPGGPYRREWAQLARAPSVEEFCSSYRLDVCAPTDDKPFFFNMKRVEDIGRAPPPGYFYAVDPLRVLAVTLAILLVLCAAGFALPLLAVRREGRPGVGPLAFFAAIGLGFLILEIVLIQRFVLFLGFPTYALSVVIAALLVFTGVGALASARLPSPPRRGLMAALAAVSVMIAAAAFGLQPLLRALIDLPFAGRVAVTVALLAPLGIGMGVAMPVGLQRLQALHPGGVPWAWAINGITSVLASVLGVAIALTAGFTVATLAACACYLGALAHAAFGRWPGAASADAGRSPDRAPAPELRPAAPAPGRSGG
jgi:spermidine synthase